MSVPVTLLYGGLCGLLLTVLALNVTIQRGRHKAGLGHMPPELIRHARAHGNAIEYVPIALILLLALELSGFGGFWLHVFGGTFVLARTLYAIGFIFKVPVGGLGVALNHAVITTMSVVAVAQHFKK